MQFRNGMLGVAVIAVALAAALMGSWVMSMDLEEREVTKYNQLADVTPLFGSEPAPEYITYDPVSNYTGYFTEDTIIDGVTYFGGVDFKESNRASNFRLNLAPEEFDSGTYDLSQIEEYDSDYRYVMYADYNANDGFYLKRNNFADNSSGGHTISLADLVETLNEGHDYDSFKFSSTDGLVFSNPYGVDVSVDWCVFSILSEWSKYRDSYYYIDFASAAALQNPSPAYKDHVVAPKLSAVADLKLNQVILYYDNEFRDQAGIYTLDDVLITTAGGVHTVTVPAGYIAFGTTINYVVQNLPDPKYMDPSAGVELE